MAGVGVISRTYYHLPQALARFLHCRLGIQCGHYDYRKAAHLEDYLREQFRRYTTSNLVGITPDDFEAQIQSKLGTVDASIEGYSQEGLDHQRDLSIKFHWGHNHDFGTFSLAGRMGDHHIRLVRDFCSMFPVTVDDFRDRDVLDIGVWTGGTSLVLAGLGSRVVAVEEVRKYADMVTFLSKSFGISDRLCAVPKSLYTCQGEEFYERFDIIYFPGVLYHLSDPVVALRNLYNACRVGGMILLQSQGIRHRKPYCQFEGSYVYKRGQKSDLSRGGWNWFLPSASAICRMLTEAGFTDISARYFGKTIFAFARKTSRVDVCRAGLSVRDIQ